MCYVPLGKFLQDEYYQTRGVKTRKRWKRICKAENPRSRNSFNDKYEPPITEK